MVSDRDGPSLHNQSFGIGPVAISESLGSAGKVDFISCDVAPARWHTEMQVC